MRLGIVPAIIIGGGIPEAYEGLGFHFFRINDWKHALSHAAHQINRHLLPKPIGKVLDKVNAKVEHIDAKISHDFVKLKHWSQKHRALSAIIIASILTMGAASFMAGGFAANMGAWATAAGHAVSGGASAMMTALSGHTAASVFTALAPQIIKAIAAKKAAGEQLSAQDMQTLQMAQASQGMDSGMVAAMQGAGTSSMAAGGGWGMPDMGMMTPPDNSSIKENHVSMMVPLALGAGIVLIMLARR